MVDWGQPNIAGIKGKIEDNERELTCLQAIAKKN
jgi:hypothetical protein